ncbi:YcaO-like family protein [Micromonospora sp. SL4-19]|uniref:YcaO-like family protein n=1 Tax=Micromonospora sp. SL4-19 TaxID=3399129 RepID=UPI003A4D8666
MIDVTRTMATSTGIASAFSLAPPYDTNPLWSASAELLTVPGVELTDVPLSARVVGAHGHSRVDALIRGAGEAVERYALHPRPGLSAVRGRAAELGEPTLAFHDPHIALGAPEAAQAELTWVPGRRLRNSATVLVPAPLVDWPSLEPEAAFFDPGPSGAAAGSSPEMALRSALLEIVERDAVTVAWERGLRLPSFPDPAEMTAVDPAGQKARTALLTLWRRAHDEGIIPSLARLPTAVPGLWCVVGALVDPPGPGAIATVGLKGSDRPWEALLGAFQEAWQVRTALELTRAEGGATDPVTMVETEHDRIRHMLTAAGYESVRDWVMGFTAAGEATPTTATVADQDILRAVLADGGDPVLVDLTPRLPAAVRAMGWCAVKVLPVGYQHLRMNERHRWSWNRPRLASAVGRTGHSAQYPGPCPDRPHPLP